MQITAAPTFHRPLQAPKQPQPQPPAPEKSPGLSNALSYGMDRLVDFGYAVSAVPKFIYPTVVGNAQQQAWTWQALDTLPMHHAVLPSTIVTKPSLPMGPELLGQNRMSIGQIQINQGGYGMHYPSDFQETVIHEVGHSVDYKAGLFSIVSKQNHSSEGPFGKGPYVSDYAETQHAEDFAESYRVHHTNPRELQAVNPAKAEQMRRLDQPHWLQKMVDRPAYRETGKFIGRQFQGAPILRDGLELLRQASIATLVTSGATETIGGIVKGNAGRAVSGALNATAGVALAFTPHAPTLGLVAAAALGANKGLAYAQNHHGDSTQKVLASTGGAVGGLVGGFVAPLALTQVGYSVAGPIGGTVGLVVGGLMGSQLGSTLGAKAGMALGA